MIRPRPHVPGATNAAVKPDGSAKLDDAAQPGVPKSLRNPKMLAAARARAARDDRMRYIRTDLEAGAGSGPKGGDAGGGR